MAHGNHVKTLLPRLKFNSRRFALESRKQEDNLLMFVYSICPWHFEMLWYTAWLPGHYQNHVGGTKMRTRLSGTQVPSRRTLGS
jgi:hypothetical protein